MKFCTSCGKQIPDDAKFCGHCSAAQPQAAPTAPVAPPAAPQAVPPVFPMQPNQPQKPKKKGLVVAIAIVAALAVVGIVVGILIGSHVICLSHEYSSATCVKSARCVYCGKEESGDLAPHIWVTADCENAMHCDVCGTVDGEPLGHLWGYADCLTYKSCMDCGAISDETGEHLWVEATCQSAKHCETCLVTEGEPGDHVTGDWTVELEATLISKGYEVLTCTACGETVDSREIPEAVPGIENNQFNFNDQEFIAWLNAKNQFTVHTTPMDIEDNINTYYQIDFSDGKYGFIAFVHSEGDKYGRITAMTTFSADGEQYSAAVIAYIGQFIDPAFVTNDCLEKIVLGNDYEAGGMTARTMPNEGSPNGFALFPFLF